MLLIAQPKSASTSLMWSIAEILKITHKNGQTSNQDDVKSKGFEELQKYHGTTVKRNFNYLDKYISNRSIIYKEHILPTYNHLKSMSKINKPVVVLLRKPEETMESYKRVFSVLPELKNVNFNKLYEEVEMFYNIYMRIKNKIYLKIYFRDVIFDFENTMKNIIEHYKFKIPKDLEKYELQKRNYTGHGLRKIIEDKS